MLFFVLYFLSSFLCILWSALFNNACRDLPPSRALAIAQGRLDPISMCAFNEFVCKEPCSPQHTLTEPKLALRNSSDRPSFQQGGVWLGTDEELLSMLAAGGPELSRSRSPMRECASPRNVQPDHGFLVHLTSISNRKTVAQPPLEEQQPPASKTGIVLLSPGKKRVVPPPPNNNPFKRVKLYDTSSSFSSEASFLFDTVPDERASCRDHCLGKPSFTPQHACHDTGQVNQVKPEAQRSNATVESADNYGNCSLISIKTGNLHDLVHEESITVAPLPAQDLERAIDIGNSASDAHVLKEPEQAEDAEVSMESKGKTPAALPADGFGIKPVQGRCTRSPTTSIHPDSELSMLPVLQNAGAQQSSFKGYPISTAHHMMLTSASHPVQAGMESSKTTTLIKQTQRELKSEKEIRSSSKLSSKVVMVASTPSLLKFFQRAPTL